MTLKCYFKDRQGDNQTGQFLGVFQHSHTHGDSAMIGGFKAGTIAYPVTVVLGNDGRIYELNTGEVTVMEDEG